MNSKRYVKIELKFEKNLSTILIHSLKWGFNVMKVKNLKNLENLGRGDGLKKTFLRATLRELKTENASH